MFCGSTFVRSAFFILFEEIYEMSSWFRYLLHLTSSLELISCITWQVSDYCVGAQEDIIRVLERGVMDIAGTALLTGAAYAIRAVVSGAALFASIEARQALNTTSNTDTAPPVPLSKELIAKVAAKAAFKVILRKYSEINDKLEIESSIHPLNHYQPSETCMKKVMMNLTKMDISSLVVEGQAFYLVHLEQMLYAIPPNIRNYKMEEGVRKLRDQLKLDRVFKSNLGVEDLMQIEPPLMIFHLLKIVVEYTHPYSMEEKVKRILTAVQD